MFGSTLRELILVGAGHVHLPMLARFAPRLRRYYRVTLIGPPTFAYSGSIPDAIMNSADAPPRRDYFDEIEVERFCERHGVNFVEDKVVGIRRISRQVELTSNQEGSPRLLEFDLLSLNLGAEISPVSIPGNHEAFFPVKPTSVLRGVIPRLLAAGRRAPHLVIIGGGAAGVEIGAVLASVCKKYHLQPQVSIVSASHTLLKSAPPGAQEWIKNYLLQRDFSLHCGKRVAALQRDRVILSSGEEILADVVIGAWGTSPPPLLRSSGFAVTADGYLCVDQHLRAGSDESIYGGGDSVRHLGESYSPAGIHAVNAGHVIGQNLLAEATGATMVRYRRRRQYLQILNLGDNNALALIGRWWWHGSQMLKLKRFLDRRFIDGLL